MEVRTEVSEFLFREYINGIFVAVRVSLHSHYDSPYASLLGYQVSLLVVIRPASVVTIYWVSLHSHYASLPAYQVSLLVIRAAFLVTASLGQPSQSLWQSSCLPG